MKKILFEKLTVKETMHIMGTGTIEDRREDEKSCAYFDTLQECGDPDFENCGNPRTPAVYCTPDTSSGDFCAP